MLLAAKWTDLERTQVGAAPVREQLQPEKGGNCFPRMFEEWTEFPNGRNLSNVEWLSSFVDKKSIRMKQIPRKS